MEKAILGLDIGGTGIKGGILIKGHLEDIRSIPTPADQDKEHILETIALFIESYMQYDFAGIGIGIPGLVDVNEGKTMYESDDIIEYLKSNYLH